uniref:Uncharacterized protein n=1 Tax=Oryza punctata TaxID=4537 RepID=A0A0E0MJ19_ORYPU
MAGEFSDVMQEGARLGLKRCSNAEEAAAKRKKMMVKERLTTEEVEQLLSFVPRPFPLRDGKPRSDDPDINEAEDLIDSIVVLLNSNTQVILRAQARAREELRTKGYVERWVTKSSAADADADEMQASTA